MDKIHVNFGYVCTSVLMRREKALTSRLKIEPRNLELRGELIEVRDELAQREVIMRTFQNMKMHAKMKEQKSKQNAGAIMDDSKLPWGDDAKASKKADSAMSELETLIQNTNSAAMLRYHVKDYKHFPDTIYIEPIPGTKVLILKCHMKHMDDTGKMVESVESKLTMKVSHSDFPVPTSIEALTARILHTYKKYSYRDEMIDVFDIWMTCLMQEYRKLKPDM